MTRAKGGETSSVKRPSGPNRKRYRDDFKRSAVRLVTDEKYSFNRRIATGENTYIKSKALARQLTDQWQQEAFDENKNERTHLDEREQENFASQAQSGSRWNHLFRRAIVPGNTTVLLKHPLIQSWITAKAIAFTVLAIVILIS